MQTISVIDHTSNEQFDMICDVIPNDVIKVLLEPERHKVTELNIRD